MIQQVIENAEGAKTLRDAHKAYVDGNGSMKALVVSLRSSNSFVYRAKSDKLSTKVE